MDNKKKVNDKMLYLLNKVMNRLSDDYLITVIYGRLIKLISKYDIAKDSNSVVNILVDIGNDLVEKYFYNLYKINKKKSDKLFKSILLLKFYI